MEKEKILRRLIMPRELSIIKIFNFLNNEFINKNYELTDSELDNLLEFIRKKNEKSLDSIWTKNSMQRALFFKALKIYEFYSSKKYLSFEERKMYFLENLESISEVEEKLYKIYSFSIKKAKEYLYDDEDFTLYILNSREEEREVEWKTGDVFCHIILDGVILLEREKKVLFAEEMYFSQDLPDTEEFSSINNKYKKLIFVIKKHFFETTQLKINKYGNKKINFIGNRNLILALLKSDKSNLNKNYMFQMAIYMIELFNRGKVVPLKSAFIDLKKVIVRVINENICVDKRIIIEELLNELDISSSKLYKIFYTLFESSASKYIDKLKIERACYYLQFSENSVEEVSYKIGMTEQTFSKKFYAQVGVTPSNFRREVDENEYIFGKGSC